MLRTTCVACLGIALVLTGCDSSPGPGDGETEVERTTARLNGVDNTNPETNSTFNAETYAELTDNTETPADSTVLTLDGERIAKATNERTPAFTIDAHQLDNETLTAKIKAYATRNGDTKTDTDTRDFTFQGPTPEINLDALDLTLYENTRDAQSLDGLIHNGTLEDVTTTGPVTATTTQDSLILQPDDQHGTYTITIHASNDNGQTQQGTQATIQQLADITGQIVEATTRDHIQTQYALTSDGNIIVEGTTDMQGNFTVQLPPGTTTDSLRFHKDNFFTRVVPFTYDASKPDTSGVKEAMFSTQPGKDIGMTPEEQKEFALQTIYAGRQGNGIGYRAWFKEPKQVTLKSHPVTDDTLTAGEIALDEQVHEEIEECVGVNYDRQVNTDGDLTGVNVKGDKIWGEQGTSFYKNENEPFFFNVQVEEKPSEPGRIYRARLAANGAFGEISINLLREDLYTVIRGIEPPSTDEFGDLTILDDSGTENFGPADCELIPYLQGENHTKQNPLIDPMAHPDNTLRLNDYVNF